MCFMSKTDLAYTAGIIDGEGCIMISRVRSQRSRSGYIYGLTVAVNSTDEWLPQWLKFSFGGSITFREPHRKNESPLWMWALRSRQASDFLKLTLPYLHLKKPQAELAIKFQTRKKYGRSLPLLEEADYIAVKAMKRKGQNVEGR